MKVTFHEEDRQYFKKEYQEKPLGDLPLSGLIPYSEFVATARTDAIDAEHATWWSPVDGGLSAMKIVCLDETTQSVPPIDYPTIGYYDMMFVSYKNGVDQIRATDWINVSEYDKAIHFSLWDIGLGSLKDEGNGERGLVRIEFQKKLTPDEWKYYKTLMSRNLSTVPLFNAYEKRHAIERQQKKENLKPKWVFPAICVALLLFLFAEGWYGSELLGYGSVLLLVPPIRYLMKLVRYLRFRP